MPTFGVAKPLILKGVMMIITIVAFTDNQPNSVDYRKFTDIDKAVAFYKSMLEKDFVAVISTRKVNIKDPLFCSKQVSS
jgi:hypothetical protein